MTSAIGFLKRNYAAFNPTPVPKSPNALKLGILGAANIAPSALISPAKTHSDVVVYAVAARSKAKAEAFARKHGIPVVHGSYQELLDDPAIEVVYNPLPNGLHYEWTMKALAAGKHVLLEKPSANRAEETRQMFDLASRKGLVLLEAFHNRFHPALQRFKEIVASGELGALKSMQVSMAMPDVLFQPDDIRFTHALGGGAVMDMGAYTLSCICFLGGSPKEVLSVTHELQAPLVDRRTEAHLALADGATAKMTVDLAMPLKYGFIPSMPMLSATVVCEDGEVVMTNFVLPTVYHSIAVINRNGASTATRTEKVYEVPGRGDASWTTYRHQLECFVDKIRGREPYAWVTAEESVEYMHWNEQVYTKGGLGSRPASEFVLPQ